MDQWPPALRQFMQLATGNTVPGMWIKAALAVLIGVLVWLFLKTTLHIISKRIASIKSVYLNEQLLNTLRHTFRLGLLLVVGTYLITLFQFKLLEKLLPAVFILLFAGPIARFLLYLLGYLEKKWAEKTETKIDDIVFELLNKFSGAIIYIIAAIIALDILGINVMPFIAGAGVVGVAVGFAAKDTLSNLIAGILLIIDRPFEIGDRIEVWSAPAGSATWGDVTDIGLRATKILTTDNIVIVIPNNEIMTRDIVNYTLLSSKIRVRINIGISYDSNVEKAKSAILSVASQADWIAKDPPPKVVVRNFGESSVDLQLRVWIEDARERMNTISFITDHVKSVFDAEGIEIPYPKRDIHIIRKTTKTIPVSQARP